MDIEAHNDAGWTPLHLAAEAGSYDAVRSLVRTGANVNNTDMSYGRTALHIAVEGGHKDIVEFLLTEVYYCFFTSTESFTLVNRPYSHQTHFIATDKHRRK